MDIKFKFNVGGYFSWVGSFCRVHSGRFLFYWQWVKFDSQRNSILLVVYNFNFAYGTQKTESHPPPLNSSFNGIAFTGKI
jgi:hypothetical protein